MKNALIGIGCAMLLIGAGCATAPAAAPTAEKAPTAQEEVKKPEAVVEPAKPTAPVRGGSTAMRSWVNASGTMMLSVSGTYTVTQAASGVQSLVSVGNGKQTVVEVFLDRPLKDGKPVAFRDWVPNTLITTASSKVGGIDMYVDPATGDLYGVLDAKSSSYARIRRVSADRKVTDDVILRVVFNPSAEQKQGATVIK